MLGACGFGVGSFFLSSLAGALSAFDESALGASAFGFDY